MLKFSILAIICSTILCSAMSFGGGGDFMPQQKIIIETENKSLFGPEVLGALIVGGLGLAGVVYANRRKRND